MTEPTRRRQRKRYTDEYKREAVELFQQSGVLAAQLSMELDVATNLLYRWSRESKYNGRQRSDLRLLKSKGRIGGYGGRCSF